MRQLVSKIGAKRIRDALAAAYKAFDENGGRLPGYPSDPPWVFPLEDQRFSLQCSERRGLLKKLIYVLSSPEWMVATTARQIAERPSSIQFGFIEYLMTGSNHANSLVPDSLGPIDYLWWRLGHYFGIEPAEPSLFTDELLGFALSSARLMWNSTELAIEDESGETGTSAKNEGAIPQKIDVPRLVAWAPKGMSVPMELVAVKLPPGPVTERQWWEALTDRVAELAENAGEKETSRACRILDVPQPEELYQAGQSLVQHNLNLRTHLNLAIFDESPWPATVTENDPEIQEILEDQTLMDWVEHARSLVSPSSLD